MRKVLDSPLIPTLLLANVCALFGLGLPYVLPLPENPETNGTRAAQQELITGLRAQNVDVSQVLERPLFHLNRRPPVEKVEVAAPAAPAVKIEAPFRLVGIMGATEETRTAYMQHTANGDTIVAKKGGVAGVWTVASIGTNYVTLTYQDERKIIELTGGN